MLRLEKRSVLALTASDFRVRVRIRKSGCSLAFDLTSPLHSQWNIGMSMPYWREGGLSNSPERNSGSWSRARVTPDDSERFLSLDWT